MSCAKEKKENLVGFELSTVLNIMMLSKSGTPSSFSSFFCHHKVVL